MKVSEIMTKQVFSIGSDSSLKECAEILKKYQSNGLVVVDRGKTVGIITKADVFKAILPRYPDIIEDERHMADFEYIEERVHKLFELKVSEIMGSPVITVSSDMPIIRAGSLMIVRRIKQVPVVDGGKLVGIVTLTDIINALLEKIK